MTGKDRRSRVARWSGRGLRAAFVLCLLWATFSGRSGVQVVDAAMAARLFPAHLHGMDGEAQYVTIFHVPAPFVPGHCHTAVGHDVPPPSPDQLLAASGLAGSLACTGFVAMPAPVLTAHYVIAPPAIQWPGVYRPPLLRPPRG